MEFKKDFVLLIPYYNHYDGLVKSLKSVYYPPERFDTLIVDDGSDLPLDLPALQANMRSLNIQLIRLPGNQGIAKALNAGLTHLHTRTDFKYIARLDCGDTCHPDRFTEQVKFLNRYPEIGLLGTWCRFTDTISGKSYVYKTKTHHEDILGEMHFKCSFIHPTVMFRRETIDTTGHYPENYIHTEDYAYFWKILMNFKGAVLPKEFVIIEFSDKNNSSKNYKQQLISRIKVVDLYGKKIWYKYAGLFLLQCRLLLPKFIIKVLKYH